MPTPLSIASFTYFLQVLRIQYQKELAQNHVTIQTKFNYSWGLVKSPVREHQVEGVRLLQGMYIYFY
jgi:mitochondrial fission 1 protein